jgi:hypothetical protein
MPMTSKSKQGLAAALALSAIGGAVMVAIEPGSPQAIVIDSPIDLGVIGLGQETVQSFTIRNAGNAPLILIKTGKPHGAEVVALPASIPPDGTEEVKVRFNTFAGPGKVPVTVEVATNDPAKPKLKLEMTARVENFINIDPPQARFLMVQGAPAGTIEHHLWADDSAIHIADVSSPYPFLKVSYRAAEPRERLPEHEGQEWIIGLTLPGNAPIGPLGGYVGIITDHPVQPRVWLPVSGFVRPMFAVTPPDIDLKTFDPAEPTLGGLAVKNYADEKVRLTGVSSPIEGISGTIAEVEPGHHWKIRLTGKSSLRGPIEGRLTLHTTSPKVPVIEVPIRGMAQPRK